MEAISAAIISALITGIFGPILTLIIQRKLRDSELPTPAKERLRRLKGRWHAGQSHVVLYQLYLTIMALLVGRNCSHRHSSGYLTMLK
jgi:hypothetical protein